ncbi:MAG TPA: 50S ribosomal protein L17 [Tepidisphaeraceae bacterium]|jgi:large subunit ribosomal protein L17|nr:50S ribosomal protein L17 [Tepidisphaeraceae bacterium]
MMRGRQLSRDTEHRKALRRNLIQSLFEHGSIRTTGPKAKEVKALAEKLITLAKTGTLNARRAVIATLQDRRVTDEDQEFVVDEKGREMTVVRRLFDEIAPTFADRNGGYTQIIKTSDFRIGDGGDIVVLQLVTKATAPTGTIRRSAGLRRKRNEKRHAFAAKLAKAAKGESAPAETPAAT